MLYRSVICPTYFTIRALSSSPNIHHAANKMLILSESDVKRCLDLPTCLEVNRKALISIASGDALVPTRLALPYHHFRGSKNNDNSLAQKDAEDWTLFKPAAFQQTSTKDDVTATETLSMGMKVVSIRSGNAATGHPLVPATILHIHPETGIVDAVVSATYLTAARTAAGSTLAIQQYFRQCDTSKSSTSFLPNQKPQHLAVFGAGLQADLHIRSIASAFNYKIPRVTIINRNVHRAEALKEQLLSESNPMIGTCCVVQLTPESFATLEETILLEADVIVACTNTVTPLWGIGDASRQRIWNRSAPCIITGIGSYTPAMQEIPSHVVNECQEVWIDTPDAVCVGDLQSLTLLENETRIGPRLLGSVLQQQETVNASKLTSNDKESPGLVFYKSVGTAIQDVLTNNEVVRRAKEQGIGTEIDMS